jgi:hypothetical protein
MGKSNATMVCFVSIFFLFSILYEGLILFLDYYIIHNCMEMHCNAFLAEFYF